LGVLEQAFQNGFDVAQALHRILIMSFEAKAALKSRFTRETSLLASTIIQLMGEMIATGESRLRHNHLQVIRGTEKLDLRGGS